MGYKARKTEHSGAKRGTGAYWGPTQDAKRGINKIRRRAAKIQLRGETSRILIEAEGKGHAIHISESVDGTSAKFSLLAGFSGSATLSRP